MRRICRLRSKMNRSLLKVLCSIERFRRCIPNCKINQLSTQAVEKGGGQRVALPKQGKQNTLFKGNFKKEDCYPWLVTSLTKHPTQCCPYISSIQKETQSAVQQDDCAKDFYMTIVNGSLECALKKYPPHTGPTDKKSVKSVIVVGAGVSGLAAAFELSKVGIETEILELQYRVGGRTKTLREGFSTGLHAEGGAMRIPPNHFLTHGYIDKFKIPMREFTNYNGKTWLCLQGEQVISTEDWENENKTYSRNFFPGWDKNIPENSSIDGIRDYYKKTIEPVRKDLHDMITKHGNQEGWEIWVNRWSKLSVDEFLRIKDEDNKYRGWPEEAIRGLQISSYSPSFDLSLVEHIRDELGEWWLPKLETPTDGMDSIAKNFIKPHNEINVDLSNDLHFGTRVHRIHKNENKGNVQVTGTNVITGMEKNFCADAVIVTVPLTILSQMDIDLPIEYKRAIRYFNYGAATKIVLQCKTRFWEKKFGSGGFTKTDLPIGQIHYPSRGDPPKPNERGLLVCYTWHQDALIFGSQSQAEAINSAVRQVATIHPEIIDEFEVGRVQAWFSDDSSQGANAALRPYQYIDGMKTLMTPNHPIYLAGEAISYSNAWIQGAIESGLNAAYHLYAYNRK